MRYVWHIYMNSGKFEINRMEKHKNLYFECGKLRYNLSKEENY